MIFCVNQIFRDFGIMMWDYYAHSNFVDDILLLIGLMYERTKEDCYGIIERDFPLALSGNDLWKWLI